MKWLNFLIGSVLTGFGLDTNTRIGGSILFFIYDVLKITILLCVLIFLISYIQSYFPPERSRKILRNTPMEKFGEPSDLIGTLLWLCDEGASGFVNGIVVPVDGGFSAYSGV